MIAVDPGDARQTAREILAGRKYKSSPTPRPFRKQLSWIGDRLHGPLDWIGRVLSHVPGIWLLVIAFIVIGLAIALIVSKVRARAGRADVRRRAHRVTDSESEDPTVLERAADAAELAGHLDEALRLRFRAGLLRLGDRGAIRYRSSVTTNEVRRALGSEAFDELARTFEAVAYGGRGAVPPDLDAARREWPRVVSGSSKSTGD